NSIHKDGPWSFLNSDGYFSHFLKKCANPLLHPPCCRRRRCPCAGDGVVRCDRRHRPCWRQPFTSAPRVAPCGCIVGSLLRAGRSRPCPQVAAPLRPTAPASGCPLQVVDSPLAGGPWLQPAAPVRGLAMASRHLAGGLGRNRLPLAASHGQPLLAVLAANALNDSTRFNLITRSLKPIFCMKTLALIPLLGNLNGAPVTGTILAATCPFGSQPLSTTVVE
ncbi:hypothetical protein BHE74_00006250, partial [Ensete ventricosum]